MAKTALIIGTGLGGLSTALRLSKAGYKVQMVEKHHRPGGRLNFIEQDGFQFDVGPSFFSMSYEFRELFSSLGEEVPFEINELNPLYTVWFENRDKPYRIYKNIDDLAREFEAVEPGFAEKANAYLKKAGTIFQDTEFRIVKRNHTGKLQYLAALATVPMKHLPMMFRSMWAELEKNFNSEDVKVIFSLVSFFLGATPFETPAVYSLLNYTEMQHDGYWNVKGGMYKIVQGILPLLEKYGVSITDNTEITGYTESNGKISGFTDASGKTWTADVYVCNADAAWFRGAILGNQKFSEPRLDAMDWTLAPFTIYLGVKGRIPNIEHHNYFLGNNFREYADNIFKTSVAPNKPYYYVNVASKSNPECAPEGCENLFILCPVPDLRHKPDWSDAQTLADNIISDLGKRVGYDISGNILTRTVYTPVDWQKMFNLYKGSGLGLAHGMNQIGALRPANKDEKFGNLYYVGASTHPGTGLPIVVIGSRLVTERIIKEQ